jgi:cell division protein FtsQ
MKFSSKKISNFILINPLNRRLSVFFYHVLKPLVIKILLGFLTLIILIFIALKFFFPQQLNKINYQITKKAQHYLSLDLGAFEKIKISGNKKTSSEEIDKIVRQVLQKYPKEINAKTDSNYQNLVQDVIVAIRANLPWVKDVTLSRSIPDILNVRVSEYEPFAIWQEGEKKYIIDRDGNKIDYQELEGLEKMVVLSGQGANINARSLFNIFAIDSVLSQQVYSATWVGNRRWDIRLDNGLLIKLPENNIAGAWHNLIKIYELPGSLDGIRVIDLRIAEKVYLQYEDSGVKKLQKI